MLINRILGMGIHYWSEKLNHNPNKVVTFEEWVAIGMRLPMKCDKTKVYVLRRLLNAVVHIFKCVNHMFQGISSKCLYFSTVTAQGSSIMVWDSPSKLRNFVFASNPWWKVLLHFNNNNNNKIEFFLSS